MKQVIFIASLSRSGSTLLDLMLGCHPRIVGLGEVLNVVSKGASWMQAAAGRDCSCGARIPDCPFWGAYARHVEAQGSLDVPRAYRFLLDHFTQAFGEDTLFLDSSKDLPALDVLAALPDVQVRAIHLVKDVRAYTVSHLDAARRKKDHRRGQRWLRSIPAYEFWRWYIGNRRIERCLAGHGLERIRISYEALCLSTDATCTALCRFLGLPEDEDLQGLRSSGSHIIKGNRMRSQDEKAAITYDQRWFVRREWLLPSLVFPHIMRYNRDRVYAQAGLDTWAR